MSIDALVYTDIAPPNFAARCPRNVSVTTQPCTIKANVTYDVPEVTDNASAVTMVGPNETLPILLSRGRHQRMHTARDRAGNVAACLTNINVVGECSNICSSKV